MLSDAQVDLHRCKSFSPSFYDPQRCTTAEVCVEIFMTGILGRRWSPRVVSKRVSESLLQNYSYVSFCVGETGRLRNRRIDRSSPVDTSLQIRRGFCRAFAEINHAERIFRVSEILTVLSESFEQKFLFATDRPFCDCNFKFSRTQKHNLSRNLYCVYDISLHFCVLLSLHFELLYYD